MARQGNYVTVPSGSANWASGLSDSLSDLSKGFLDQAEKERESQRLDSIQKESSRRYDEELAMKQQEARAKEQDRIAKNLVDTAAQKRAQTTFDQQQSEFNRTLKNREILEGYNPDITFNDIQEYTPNLASNIRNAGNVDRIEQQLNIAGELFAPGLSDTERKSKVAAYVGNIAEERGKELTPNTIDEMTQRIDSLATQVATAKPEDRDALLNSAYDSLGLTALRESRDNFLQRAPQALTSEEAKSLHIARLRKAGVPLQEAEAEANAIVKSNYSRQSRASILEARTKAAELANERLESRRESAEDYIDTQLNIIDKIGTGSSFKGSGDPVADITRLLKEGGVHSNVDDDELNQLVTRYQELLPNYGNDVAMAATLDLLSLGSLTIKLLVLIELKNLLLIY